MTDINRESHEWARILGVFLIMGILLVGCRNDVEVGTRQAVSLRVDAPSEMLAGEEVIVQIQGGIAGETAVLVVDGGYGVVVEEGVFDQAGVAEVKHTPEIAGVMHLTAVVRKSQASASVKVIPHEAVEPLVPLVGARSITADGKKWAMTVIVPHDKFGNAIADGTAFTQTVQHPDNVVVTERRISQHLLTWWRVTSRTTSGTATIAVNGDGVYGREADLLEVPGWPVPFELTTTAVDPVADGRGLVLVETAVLKDEYGNVLPDGTVVKFIVNDESVVTGVTVDGSAEITLQSPKQAQTFSVVGELYSTISTPLEITFLPQIETFDLHAKFDADLNAIIIDAGPLLGRFDQFIADGTPADIVLNLNDGVRLTTTTTSEDGYINAQIPLDQNIGGKITVTLGGVSQTILLLATP